MVQWNDELEEIPISSYYSYNDETDDGLPIETDNDASQTFGELINGNDSFGQDDSFFDTLNEETDDYFAPVFP
jgi:hypothetical protein